MRRAGSRRSDRGWPVWPAPARPAVSSRAGGTPRRSSGQGRGPSRSSTNARCQRSAIMGAHVRGLPLPARSRRERGAGGPRDRRRDGPGTSDRARVRADRRPRRDRRPAGRTPRGGGVRARVGGHRDPVGAGDRRPRTRPGRRARRRRPGSVRPDRRAREQRGRPVRRDAGGHLGQGLARGAASQRRRGVGPDPDRRGAFDDPGWRRARRVHRVQPAPGHPADGARLRRAGGAGEPGGRARDRVEPPPDPRGVRRHGRDRHRGVPRLRRRRSSRRRRERRRSVASRRPRRWRA